MISSEEYAKLLNKIYNLTKIESFESATSSFETATSSFETATSSFKTATSSFETSAKVSAPSPATFQGTIQSVYILGIIVCITILFITSYFICWCRSNYKLAKLKARVKNQARKTSPTQPKTPTLPQTIAPPQWLVTFKGKPIAPVRVSSLGLQSNSIKQF